MTLGEHQHVVEPGAVNSSKRHHVFKVLQWSAYCKWTKVRPTFHWHVTSLHLQLLHNLVNLSGWMEEFPMVCLVIIYGLCLSGLVEKLLFFFPSGRDSFKASALERYSLKPIHFLTDVLSKLPIQVIAHFLQANTLNSVVWLRKKKVNEAQNYH